MMDANTVAQQLRDIKYKLKNKHFGSADQRRVWRKTHARLTKQWKAFITPKQTEQQLNINLYV